ncbi:MAG: DUF2304 domain-containing protein [Candidatus Aminicenantes bacterium]|nr:DUF2304 domain-containing protein [Candidatus Aminicenantes bacterium]
MPVKQALVLAAVFVVLFGWVLRMAFRNRLRESHAVLWIGVSLAIPASILLYPVLVKVSGLVGFIAPVNFSFLMAFIALFVICLHFSALSSELERAIKNSAQKIALLEEEVRRLREREEPAESPGGDREPEGGER